MRIPGPETPRKRPGGRLLRMPSGRIFIFPARSCTVQHPVFHPHALVMYPPLPPGPSDGPYSHRRRFAKTGRSHLRKPAALTKLGRRSPTHSVLCCSVPQPRMTLRLTTLFFCTWAAEDPYGTNNKPAPIGRGNVISTLLCPLSYRLLYISAMIPSAQARSSPLRAIPLGAPNLARCLLGSGEQVSSALCTFRNSLGCRSLP